MARMDVSNALSPAWNHMVQLLFRPFSLKTWLALGFVSMLAAQGGGGNFNMGNNNTSRGGGPGQSPSGTEIIHWITNHLPLIIGGIVLLIIIGLLFSWISSVMRFVYIEQLTRNPRAIREPFHRLRSYGTSYFFWRIGFGLIALVIMGLLVGIPVAIGVSSGSSNAGAVAIVVILAILIGIPVILALVIIAMLANDFVIPTMYTRNLRVIDAWRVAWPLIKQNSGQIALYILLLIVIGIATAIASIFVVLASLLILAIPLGLLAGIGWAGWNAVGHTFSAGFISLVAILGIIALSLLSFVLSCLLQPATAFRRSFALVAWGQADPSMSLIPARQAPPTEP